MKIRSSNSNSPRNNIFTFSNRTSKKSEENHQIYELESDWNKIKTEHFNKRNLSHSPFRGAPLKFRDFDYNFNNNTDNRFIFLFVFIFKHSFIVIIFYFSYKIL